MVRSVLFVLAAAAALLAAPAEKVRLVPRWKNGERYTVIWKQITLPPTNPGPHCPVGDPGKVEWIEEFREKVAADGVFHRTYVRSEVWSSPTRSKRRRSSRNQSGIEGETVQLRTKGDGLQAIGKAPGKKYFNTPSPRWLTRWTILLPKEPVAVADSWKVENDRLSWLLEHAGKVTGKCFLRGLVGGKAVIEIDVTIKGVHEPKPPTMRYRGTLSFDLKAGKVRRVELLGERLDGAATSATKKVVHELK